MLSRFHLIPERYGQTDRFAISISRVSMLTRDKNLWKIGKGLNVNFATSCHVGRKQGCHKCFLPMKNYPPWNLCLRFVTNFPCLLKNCPNVNNYPTLTFMLLVAAASSGVPYASSPVINSPPPKIYCRYFVCAADARSVCDSYVSC